MCFAILNEASKKAATLTKGVLNAYTCIVKNSDTKKLLVGTEVVQS